MKKVISLFLLTTLTLTACGTVEDLDTTLNEDEITTQKPKVEDNMIALDAISGEKVSVDELSFEELFSLREKKKAATPTFTEPVYTIEGIIDPCSEAQSDNCGLDLYILADPNWESESSSQVFYFQEESLNDETIYYGPFESDLKRIIDEAEVYISTL